MSNPTAALAERAFRERARLYRIHALDDDGVRAEGRLLLTFGAALRNLRVELKHASEGPQDCNGAQLATVATDSACPPFLVQFISDPFFAFRIWPLRVDAVDLTFGEPWLALTERQFEAWLASLCGRLTIATSVADVDHWRVAGVNRRTGRCANCHQIVPAHRGTMLIDDTGRIDRTTGSPIYSIDGTRPRFAVVHDPACPDGSRSFGSGGRGFGGIHRDRASVAWQLADVTLAELDRFSDRHPDPDIWPAVVPPESYTPERRPLVHSEYLLRAGVIDAHRAQRPLAPVVTIAAQVLAARPRHALLGSKARSTDPFDQNGPVPTLVVPDPVLEVPSMWTPQALDLGPIGMRSRRPTALDDEIDAVVTRRARMGRSRRRLSPLVTARTPNTKEKTP